MWGSQFVFDYVQLLYYKCHTINLNRGGSYIDSPDWEGINYSSQKDDWEKFEKNNVTIALNVLYAKKEKKSPLCFKT